jgi:hypothetical protein
LIHRWKKTALFLCETVIVSNYYRINLPPQIFSRISEIRPFKSSPIWLKERFSLVSVCIKKKQWQILWKRRNVTLFRCRALRRCCAPCGPIWLEEMSSVVSVYVKKTAWEIRRKATEVTLFCCRALARCCAPSSPIQL